MSGVSAGPDFLGVGMQKTGTGWLYEHLSHHPQAWMPPVKELRFLTGSIRRQRLATMLAQIAERGLEALNRKRATRKLRPLAAEDVAFIEALAATRKGGIDFDRYRHLFDAKGDRLSGDVTPAYSTLPDGRIARIAKELPGVKVVLGIRDPIARFWSHLSGRIVRDEGYDLAAAVKAGEWAPVEAVLKEEDVERRSRPTAVAAAWRAHVPADRFHLIFFDDLQADPGAVRGAIATFLGIDPGAFPADLEPGWDSKANMPKAPMAPALHERLVAYFADELRACAETFGGPAGDWPVRHGLT